MGAGHSDSKPAQFLTGRKEASLVPRWVLNPQSLDLWSVRSPLSQLETQCVCACVCVCVCVCARARACLCVGWRGVEMSVHVGEKREEWWKAGVYVSAGVR